MTDSVNGEMSPERVSRILEDANIATADFTDLLNKIDYASPETKKLWREIYSNASDERAKALCLYADLYRHVISGDQSGHVNHGKTMTMYLERMSKCNDQLLRLAELIETASSFDGEVDGDSIYDQIQKESVGKSSP